MPTDRIPSATPTTEHRAFDQIQHVTSFTPTNAGPRITWVRLSAALTPSLDYPRSRLSVCSQLGNLVLTVHQAAQLRDQLTEAIEAVLASCSQMATPDDVERLPKEMPRG
jgi:hypothetical protein